MEFRQSPALPPAPLPTARTQPPHPPRVALWLRSPPRATVRRIARSPRRCGRRTLRRSRRRGQPGPTAPLGRRGVAGCSWRLGRGRRSAAWSPYPRAQRPRRSSSRRWSSWPSCSGHHLVHEKRDKTREYQNGSGVGMKGSVGQESAEENEIEGQAGNREELLERQLSPYDPGASDPLTCCLHFSNS